MTDLVYDIIADGGPVLVIIFLLSCWSWSIVIGKILWLRDQKEASLLLEGRLNPEEISEKGKSSFLFCLSEEIRKSSGEEADFKVMEKTQILETEGRRNLATLNTCAAIAPLLGLLGTVTGMVRTFTMIQLFGGAGPALLADGISEALLTTEGGLIAAFPLIIAFSWLKSRTERINKIFYIYCVKMRGSDVQNSAPEKK